MRTFRMIGMALTTTLMCVSLTSCEPNDDSPAENSTSTGSSDNKGVESSEKRLAMVMEYKIEDGRKVLQESYEFVYNDNGNVTEIREGWTSYGDSWQTDITTPTWDGSKSFTSPWDGSEEYSEYLVDNGRISKELYYCDGVEEYYYDYDKGHICEFGEICEGKRDKLSTYSWNGNQLSMTVELIAGGEESCSFIYSNNQTCFC